MRNFAITIVALFVMMNASAEFGWAAKSPNSGSLKRTASSLTVITDFYSWFELNSPVTTYGVHSLYGNSYASSDPVVAAQQILDMQQYFGSDALVLLVWPGQPQVGKTLPNGTSIGSPTGGITEYNLDHGFFAAKQNLGSHLRFGLLYGYSSDLLKGYVYDSKGVVDFSLQQNQDIWRNDLQYLRQKYLNHSDVYRINGKAVFYFWNGHIRNFNIARQIANQEISPGIYAIIGLDILKDPKTHPDQAELKNLVSSMDAVMSYVPYSASWVKKYGSLNSGYISAMMDSETAWITYLRKFAKGVAYIPAVSFHTNDTLLLDRVDENGNPLHPPLNSTDTTRKLLMRKTLALINDNNLGNFLRVGTWNELAEGTAFEPSIEFGYSFLNTIKSYLGK